MIKFFKGSAPQNICKGVASGIIGRIFSNPNNKELWEKYLYVTGDELGDTQELEPYDLEELKNTIIPENWNPKKYSQSGIDAAKRERLQKIIDSIDTLNPFEENRDIFSTSILANSFQLNFDSEGRVTIPDKFLNHSGIKEKVLFVGQGKTFQMWEPSEFKNFSNDARKKANLKRSELKWKQTN